MRVGFLEEKTGDDGGHMIKIQDSTEIPLEAYLQRMPSAMSRSQDNFKQLAEFSGSESEREAHRKNRVIQMRLGISLSELTLQQRSSAQIHKMEEARFLQKVKSGTNQPRSAKMLAQFRSGQSHVSSAPRNIWPLRARVHNTRSDRAATSRMSPGQSPLSNNHLELLSLTSKET